MFVADPRLADAGGRDAPPTGRGRRGCGGHPSSSGQTEGKGVSGRCERAIQS